MRKLLVTLAAATVALLVAVPVDAGDVASYAVTMNGANEVPGPGDPDGTGDAVLQLGTVSNEVCVDELTLNDIDEPTAMHIHDGSSTEAGPIVVDLSAALTDTPFCTFVTPELMAELITSPECYYLNVHTGQFPNGAIRGQLVDGTCETTPTSDTTASTTSSTAATGGTGATRPSFTG
jgi:hypothetical protein